MRSTEIMAPPRVAAANGSDRLSPVLLVHGLGGTASGWLAMTVALRAHGLTVAAISYQSFGTSVEQLAAGVADAVDRLLDQTGADRVHLVGHSLGGVVIAQAFADGLLTEKVDSVITMATPFGGSPWATLLPISATVRAMRQGSPLLRRLARVPSSHGVRWLAITASHDRVVPGPRSRPIHAEVDTMAVEGVGHVGLRLNPRVIDQVVRAIVVGRAADERAVA